MPASGNIKFDVRWSSRSNAVALANIGMKASGYHVDQQPIASAGRRRSGLLAPSAPLEKDQGASCRRLVSKCKL
jgi:hypothetical protein